MEKHDQEFCDDLANDAIRELFTVCDTYVPMHEFLDRKLNDIEDTKMKVEEL